MALFKQKGRKTWQARIWVPELGRTRSFSTRTADDFKAKQIELELRSAAARRAEHKRVVQFVESITMQSIAQTGLLISAAWKAYTDLPEIRLSAEQQRKKEHHWAAFVAYVHDRYPGVQFVHEIGRDTAFGFMDSLRSGRKGKTLNNIRGNVGSVLNALRYRAGLAENPFAVVRCADTQDSLAGRAFTDDEVRRLLKVAPEPYYGATLVALYTGLRFVDIAKLRWESVKADRLQLTPSKTRRHGIRVVIPLHDQLRRYLEAKTRGDSEYVFPDLARRYGSSARNTDYRDILNKAGIAAGAGEYVSFHSLRHTFRTRLSRAEVRQEIVMKLGGWKTGAIAELYNHDTDSLRAAIDRLQ